MVTTIVARSCILIQHIKEPTRLCGVTRSTYQNYLNVQLIQRNEALFGKCIIDIEIVDVHYKIIIQFTP